MVSIWPSTAPGTTHCPTCSSACCSEWGLNRTGSRLPPVRCAGWNSRDKTLRSDTVPNFSCRVAVRPEVLFINRQRSAQQRIRLGELAGFFQQQSEIGEVSSYLGVVRSIHRFI